MDAYQIMCFWDYGDETCVPEQQPRIGVVRGLDIWGSVSVSLQ